MCEREWRFLGNLNFKYSDIAAIIADDPEKLIELCEYELWPEKMRVINKIPIISPEWNYEEIIDQMSIKI